MTSTTSRRPRRPLVAFTALCALVGIGYSACTDSTAPVATVASGTVSAFAGGTGHSYVVLDPDRQVTEVGIRFSENVLSTLPSGTAMVDYTFDLPAEASLTPYQQVVVGWNPMGHPPTVYQAPHFDVHFYQISPAAREQISPADPLYSSKLARQPAAALIPANYVMSPGGVPRMGAHWSDTTAPEQNGQPFTSTFIYGSYDGAFIFAEPMIATSFLATHPTKTSTLKLPAGYATPGRYPTTYTVSFDATSGEYVVALGGFVTR